uniref:Uncharacterized protein n=1 Tax=Denticeps clupeoides TaxID=299321 RepID=A0AAY4BZX1_9TELE
MPVLDARLLSLFRGHWHQTLTCWSVFFSFGLCIAFLGPTILDLRCQTQSTLQEITWVFFSQQLFLFLGSSVGGVFSKTLLSSLSALTVSTLLISIVFAIIPLCQRVLGLAIAMAVAGLAMGIIDTIANLQLVRLYQKDSTVFLQVLHFFVGLGALLSPLIADPFLSDTNCILPNGTVSNSTTFDHLRHKLVPVPVHNTSQYPLYTEGQVVTNVSYAFWIMAFINLPVPLAVFALMYRERLVCGLGRRRRLLDGDELAIQTRDLSAPGQRSTESREDTAHGTLLSCCNHGDLRRMPLPYLCVHLLGGLVLFFADGIVGSYAGFVYSYAVEPPLSLPHKTAGYLTSVFWAAITVGRLAAIPLSYRAPPALQLTIAQVGVVITLLLLLVLHSSSLFLFAGTFILGLCISSVYPCMLGFTEDILNYKGCATTVLVTGASMGEMLLQVFVGSVSNIPASGSYSFILSVTIFSFLGFTLFLGLLFCRNVCSRSLTGEPRPNPFSCPCSDAAAPRDEKIHK